MWSKGQTVVEYLILIGIMMMGLIYMSTDLKRGVQSVIKVTADQIGNQSNSDQDYNNPQGYLLNSISKTSENHQKTLAESKGVVGYLINDKTQAQINSLTNQGSAN
jgi:hypothetical protein